MYYKESEIMLSFSRCKSWLLLCSNRDRKHICFEFKIGELNWVVLSFCNRIQDHRHHQLPNQNKRER